MKSTKRISIIAVFTMALAVFAISQTMASTPVWQDLSTLEMNTLTGGAKHCSDDSNCDPLSCRDPGKWQVIQTATGRKCLGSPCDWCNKYNIGKCGRMDDNCNSDCSVCTWHLDLLSWLNCSSGMGCG